MNFRLAHLSDPHIGPLPKPQLRELLGKRLTGYVNWQRRANIHNMQVLGRIVADMRAQKPDHIAMTGDILNLGLPSEFALARAWMQTLGAPDEVSFVPGNHDAYVPGALPRILDTFAPWASSDGVFHASFPYVRVRGEVALIGVSSAIATAPFLASGRVGATQLQAMQTMLRLAGERGLFRVVMIHHPPWRGGATPGRGLRDAREFEQAVGRVGAELVLHGHNHRLLRRTLRSGGRAIPSIGVASASAVPGTPRHRAAYHLYDIERAGNGWKILARVRGVQASGDQIGETESFIALDSVTQVFD